LTKTDKRSTKSHKTALIEKVRECIDKYDAIYVLSFENMRATKLKDVRQHFGGDANSNDRILLGKQTLMQIALGRTPEEEYSDNLRHVAKHLAGGDLGLLFTCKTDAEVRQYFESFVEDDYARAGHTAQRDVTVEASQLTHLPSSMMEPLRKLGLPVKLSTGTIKFRDDQESVTLCKAGEVLNVEKCKLLTQFGVKLAQFKVTLKCRWCKGEYEPIM
jgi:mRNA turnover protein 4